MNLTFVGETSKSFEISLKVWVGQALTDLRMPFVVSSLIDFGGPRGGNKVLCCLNDLKKDFTVFGLLLI